MPLPARRNPQRASLFSIPGLPGRSISSLRQHAQALPDNSLRTRFGIRLRALRHAAGKTQMQIAVEFGIDRTFLSDLERGRKSVSLPFLEVFAIGYGLSLSELLNDL